MALTILKHRIPPADLFTPHSFLMTTDAKVIKVDEQHGSLAFWFICDEDSPRATRHFAIVGSGHVIPEGAQYLGTAQLKGGSLVVHLFEIERPT